MHSPRRRFLRGFLYGAMLGAAPRLTGAAADPSRRTPAQGEGPFYPYDKPTERDNDLLRIGDGELARGEPLRLAGRVTDTAGRPLPATIEIWQCDHRGVYRHPRSGRAARVDPRFQGYGEAICDRDGAFEFYTIVPVPYTGRPPHIHVKILAGGRERLTTQLYLAGHPDNARDGLFSAVTGRERGRLLIDPVEGQVRPGLPGRIAAFDFVV